MNLSRKLPIYSPELLREYLHYAESIGDFLRRRTVKRYIFPLRCDGFAMRVENDGEVEGVPARTLLIVDGGAYPLAGNNVLVAWKNGTFSMGKYCPEDDYVRIVPEHHAAIRRRYSATFWIHPVIQYDPISDDMAD